MPDTAEPGGPSAVNLELTFVELPDTVVNHSALDTQIVLEQAKGIVAAQFQLDLDAAFRLLRDHARDHGVTLAQVAGAAVDGRLNAAALQQRRRIERPPR